MAIAFDATTQSSTGSFSHTVTGANPVLIVFIQDTSSTAVSACTYNGVAMTAWNLDNPSGSSAFYLLNPATGAHTVAITGLDIGIVMAVSYTGVGSLGTAGIAAFDPADNQSFSLTSLVSNAWISAAQSTRFSSGGTSAAGTSTTQRGTTLTGTNQWLAVFDAGPVAVAGTCTINTTSTGSVNKGWHGIILNPFIATSSNSGFFNFMPQ